MSTRRRHRDENIGLFAVWASVFIMGQVLWLGGALLALTLVWMVLLAGPNPRVRIAQDKYGIRIAWRRHPAKALKRSRPGTWTAGKPMRSCCHSQKGFSHEFSCPKMKAKCKHAHAVEVLNGGKRVAWLCPVCDEQLAPEFKPRGSDAELTEEHIHKVLASHFANKGERGAELSITQSGPLFDPRWLESQLPASVRSRINSRRYQLVDGRTIEVVVPAGWLLCVMCGDLVQRPGSDHPCVRKLRGTSEATFTAHVDAT